MPWSTTEISTRSSSALVETRTVESGSEYDTAFATRLATAAVTCSSLPNTSTPVTPPVTIEIRLESASIALVSTAVAITSSSETTIGASSGSSPWSRDSSITCCTSRESRSLSMQHPAGEPLDRLRVVGRVRDRLGQQPDRAHRGLQLVADVGDEVAAHRLHPAFAGAVLDQREHQPGAQRRHPGGDVPRGHAGPRHQQLGLADLAVAAYLADQLGELLGDQRAAAHQPEGVRRRGGLQHRVGVVDDDRAAAQHRQHGGHARRAPRAPPTGRTAVLLAVADGPRQHGAAGDDGPDQRREEGLRRRIHGSIVGRGPPSPSPARAPASECSPLVHRATPAGHRRHLRSAPCVTPSTNSSTPSSTTSPASAAASRTPYASPPRRCSPATPRSRSG